MEKAIIDRIKHIETFYEQAPPGIVKEHEEAPEECIPDTEGNRKARDFLAKAPKKGLWMPLGQEVKVMQCWKCRNYGHRTGDKECPLFESGNATNEKFREMYEDPMYSILNSQSKQEQENKLKWLQQVLDKSSTDTSDSDGDSKQLKKKKKKKKSKKKDVWVEKAHMKETGNSGKKKKHDKQSKKHKKEKRLSPCSPEREFISKKRHKIEIDDKCGHHSTLERHDHSSKTHRHNHKKEKKFKKHS